MRGIHVLKTLNRSNINVNTPKAVPQRFLCLFLMLFASALFGLSFLFNTPAEIWKGSIIILASPANLITDYFHTANIGAALMNASLMTFQGILLIRAARAEINSLLIAAVFTVAGFSLFGKNLYNSIPIILGVLAYCRITRSPFRRYVSVALFGTALGPLVSEVTFNLGLPLYAGLLLGIAAGVLSGLLMPSLANHFMSFHKGFSIYNIGFTAGIIGTFFIAILRIFGVEVNSVSYISSGSNLPFSIILFSLFLIMLTAGIACNSWSFKGFGRLLLISGAGKKDFVAYAGFGVVLINMALLGILAALYVLLVGGELNGPVIGGIFTVVGFGAYGKHIRNVIPILLGVFLVGFFSLHDVYSTPALLAALFGTTLAPVSGYYGAAAGVATGGLHMALTMNISYLHAGMNLYNNGFSGGFIAAAMVPLLDTVKTLLKTGRSSNRLSAWRMIIGFQDAETLEE
jgi:hypothetical protein